MANPGMIIEIRHAKGHDMLCNLRGAASLIRVELGGGFISGRTMAIDVKIAFRSVLKRNFWRRACCCCSHGVFPRVPPRASATTNSTKIHGPPLPIPRRSFLWGVREIVESRAAGLAKGGCGGQVGACPNFRTARAAGAATFARTAGLCSAWRGNTTGAAWFARAASAC